MKSYRKRKSTKKPHALDFVFSELWKIDWLTGACLLGFKLGRLSIIKTLSRLAKYTLIFDFLL